MKRLSKTDSELNLLNAALVVIKKVGFKSMRRDAVALEAGAQPTMINHHFNNMLLFRGAVVKHAVNIEDLEVLFQVLVTPGHKYGCIIPDALKQKTWSAFILDRHL